MNECIICLEEIQNNHIVELSCCNVKLHKICLYNWISSNLYKNKILNNEINKCIYCKQQSTELDNIIEIVKQNNDFVIIDTIDVSNTNINSNETININQNNMYQCMIIFLNDIDHNIYLIFFIGLIIIFIISAPVICIYVE